MIRACPDCGGPVVTPRAQYMITSCPCGYVPRVLPDAAGHGRGRACVSCRALEAKMVSALRSLNVAAERRLMLACEERICDS